MRPNKIKTLWKEGKTAVNAWLTIPSAWSAELMAHAGYDSLTIDVQHGFADYSIALAMLQAISTTDTVPFVRPPWNEPGIIMRLLDAGAYGVICPMINSRAEAEAFVSACRYPPTGMRSTGPLRALLYAGDDYITHADETVLTLAMIETVEALEHVDEIAATPGLDGLYVGPTDLSKCMGLTELANYKDPALLRAMDKVLAAAEKHSRLPAAHANTPENAIMLSRRGYRLVTPVSDTPILRAAAAEALAQTRQGLAS
jgi:4-hydroxy-2-oxoheptanedioate aldolase